MQRSKLRPPSIVLEPGAWSYPGKHLYRGCG